MAMCCHKNLNLGFSRLELYLKISECGVSIEPTGSDESRNDQALNEENRGPFSQNYGEEK